MSAMSPGNGKTPAPEGGTERTGELDRVLTFVDAAIAIALTLLVLPLVDLAAEIHSENDSVARLLHDSRGSLSVFVLSFVVISVLWRSQHAVLRPVVRGSELLTTLLFVWTLTIVFLPFPTALLARAGDQVTTKLLYTGTFAVSGIVLLAINVVVHRTTGMRSPDLHGESIASSAFNAVTGVVVIGLSLIPSVGYLAFLLFLVVGRGESILRQRNVIASE